MVGRAQALRKRANRGGRQTVEWTQTKQAGEQNSQARERGGREDRRRRNWEYSGAVEALKEEAEANKDGAISSGRKDVEAYFGR